MRAIQQNADQPARMNARASWMVAQSLVTKGLWKTAKKRRPRDLMLNFLALLRQDRSSMEWKRAPAGPLPVEGSLRTWRANYGLGQSESAASEALPVISMRRNTWSAVKPLCNYFAFISSCPMPCGQRGEPKGESPARTTRPLPDHGQHTLARRGHPTQRVLVRITRLQSLEGNFPRSEA